MRIRLTDVAKGRHDEALPATSLTYASGEARLVLAETEQRPTVLGLIASGRMSPDAGTVTIDDRVDSAAIRRAVALVDAPDVCDPAPNVTAAGVVAEELMFAGRPSNPVAARRWLDAAGLGAIARTPIADVSPRERLALLLGLTALRPGVEGMVLVSPDRHGGRPDEWWELVESFAADGFAMLVVAGEASATVLVDRAARAEAERPSPSTSDATEVTSEPDGPVSEPHDETREPASDHDGGASADLPEEAEPEQPTGPEPGLESASSLEPRPHPDPEPTAASEPDSTLEPEPETNEEGGR